MHSPPWRAAHHNFEVRKLMPSKIASRSILDRFWLLKWVPNRGPDEVQTRLLMSTSDRSRKRKLLQALILHYQHCEDAIWLWKTRYLLRFSLCHSCRFCFTSYDTKTSKLASKSVSKVIPNWPDTSFKDSCVLETYLGRVWNDVGLSNGLPKEVREASSRH